MARYYLADFVRIGVAFIAKKKVEVLPDGRFLFHGSLKYRDEELNVMVLTRRDTVPKIEGTYDISEDAIESKKKARAYNKALREIYKNAMKENTNGIRDCVRRRTAVSVILALCMLLLCGCAGFSILGFLVRGELKFFLLLIGCVSLLRFFYRIRWRIIPYGHIEGECFEVDRKKL